jgi:polysaccharide biosynthesis transport protein
MEFSKNIAKSGGGAVRIAEQGRRPEPSSFRFIWVLWRRRYTLITAIIAMLLLAFVYLDLTPTRYTATTIIALDTQHLPFSHSEILDEPQVDEGAVESQVESIRSANVARIVIEKLKLIEDAEFAGPPTFLEKLLGTRPADKIADQADETLRTAIERFEKGLRVTRTALRSYVVEIAYTSLDHKRAASIANATAEAYIEDQLKAKYDVANRASTWMQQRITELRPQVAEAFQAVQDFKSRNNLIVSRDGKLETDAELEQMTEAIGKARAETALAQSRFMEIEAILATQSSDDALPDATVGTVTDALNSVVITKLQQQYLEDKKRAADWASRYGQNHQAVETLRADMTSLKREIREEMQRIAETYKSDLTVSRAREVSIEKKLTEVFQSNRENRHAQVKLQELESAANSLRSTYENFQTRYTQVVQQESFPSTEARVITFALPGKKTSPSPVLTFALALAGGIASGAAMAFLREQMDRATYARDQLIRELGVNCIAILPAPNGPKEPPLTLSSRIKNKLRAIVLPERILAKRKKTDSPRVLYNKEEPFSAMSEALRNIKVAVDLRNISRETRTLAIVSALAGEGKSSVAASLAATIAEAGRNVLMIDCDFRNPSLTNFFGLHQHLGVLELLYGTVNVTDVVNHNDQYGFDFLCGPTKVRPVHTADLLSSEAMRKLLEGAKENYDYVVVELPPILPVIDVQACSHLFDAFALVVEWGKTSIDDLDEAFRAAPVVRERLLGVVLNKVDAESMRRMEGYGYAGYGNYVLH